MSEIVLVAKNAPSNPYPDKKVTFCRGRDDDIDILTALRHFDVVYLSSGDFFVGDTYHFQRHDRIVTDSDNTFFIHKPNETAPALLHLYEY